MYLYIHTYIYTSMIGCHNCEGWTGCSEEGEVLIVVLKRAYALVPGLCTKQPYNDLLRILVGT